jgi:ribosome assembly protein YihI (activator of Der GTPase)
VKQVSSKLLRQTWSLIEAINALELLEISESELIQKLLERLDAQKPLADQERIYLNDYLHSKISLIKDTAESRLVSA